MQATILAIDVSNKECRQLSDLLTPLHITRRVVHAHIDSSEVIICNREFALDYDIDPAGRLSPAELNNVLSAESLELAQRLDVTLRALTPISMVVMKEDTWFTWGSQLSGVARLFEQALEHCLHPYAERFVLHPAGSPMLLEAV